MSAVPDVTKIPYTPKEVLESINLQRDLEWRRSSEKSYQEFLYALEHHVSRPYFTRGTHLAPDPEDAEQLRTQDYL